MRPRYMIDDHLKMGALRVVLPDSLPTELDIYAMYPSRRHLPSRVRTLLEFLREWFAQEQEWASLGGPRTRRGRASEARMVSAGVDHET